LKLSTPMNKGVSPNILKFPPLEKLLNAAKFQLTDRTDRLCMHSNLKLPKHLVNNFFKEKLTIELRAENDERLPIGSLSISKFLSISWG